MMENKLRELMMEWDFNQLEKSTYIQDIGLKEIDMGLVFNDLYRTKRNIKDNGKIIKRMDMGSNKLEILYIKVFGKMILNKEKVA